MSGQSKASAPHIRTGKAPTIDPLNPIWRYKTAVALTDNGGWRETSANNAVQALAEGKQRTLFSMPSL
jgi:hypothetical protein